VLFSNPCTFHVRTFYEEKFVTPYTPPTFIFECVPFTCDLYYAFDHNSDSRPHYVQLKAEIKNSIKIVFNSMEHMMGKKISGLVQKQNKCKSNEDEHTFDKSPLKESYEEGVIEVSSLTLERIDPIIHT